MSLRTGFSRVGVAALLGLAACGRTTVHHRGSHDLIQAREAAALSLAILGQPVPDFELSSIDGTRVRLSDYVGKVVVLEWFNPQCPFTTYAHTSGTLADYPAQAVERGVVWLAVNSATTEKMGGDPGDNRAARDTWGIDFPILLDPQGDVGRRFDATTTPEVFVIDPEGVLVYVGAVDNMPFGKVRGGGEGQNYLAEALEAVLAGQPVDPPARPAYGCRVKYAQPTLGR